MRVYMYDTFAYACICTYDTFGEQHLSTFMYTRTCTRICRCHVYIYRYVCTWTSAYISEAEQMLAKDVIRTYTYMRVYVRIYKKSILKKKVTTPFFLKKR